MVRVNEQGVSLARQLLRELIILAVIIIGIVATSLPAAILFQPDETHATTKTTGAVLNAEQPQPLVEQRESKENVAFRPQSASGGMH